MRRRLAFDTKRGKLWRIDHWHPTLRRINPATLTLEASFALPLDIPGFGTDAAGFGLAYDPVRDLLYASFGHVSGDLGSGAVLKIDPNTGANLGTLFITSQFATFGTWL